MKTLEVYLSQYAESHQSPTNVKIHTFCVPLILWSVLAFAHTFFVGFGAWRASHLVTVLILFFYLSLKRTRVVLAMGLVVGGIFLSFLIMPSLRVVSISIFILSWIGQFYGHSIEGKKPSFFQDIFFLLIGPVWVVGKFCPRILK